MSNKSTGIYARYWKAYGGIRALVTSRYFWFAFFLSVVMYPHWSKPGWWEDVLGIMPDLVGFSLGGFAMWIAIGDSNFRELISGKEESENVSPFMSVNASFVHFIVLQILALILALLCKAFYFRLPANLLPEAISQIWHSFLVPFGYWIAFFVFIYGIVSAAAATMSILQTASWYDDFMTNKRKNGENSAPDERNPYN